VLLDRGGFRLAFVDLAERDGSADEHDFGEWRPTRGFGHSGRGAFAETVDLGASAL
jgi:hypothetical protein